MLIAHFENLNLCACEFSVRGSLKVKEQTPMIESLLLSLKRDSNP